MLKIARINFLHQKLTLRILKFERKKMYNFHTDILFNKTLLVDAHYEVYF